MKRVRPVAGLMAGETLRLMKRLLEAELIYGRLLDIAEPHLDRALQQGAEGLRPATDGAATASAST